jgi:hypothetical protein
MRTAYASTRWKMRPAQAEKIAAELAQDGDHYRSSAVSVTDEDDNELMRTPPTPLN